jgi:hemolysin activation/secretion protein
MNISTRSALKSGAWYPLALALSLTMNVGALAQAPTSGGQLLQQVPASPAPATKPPAIVIQRPEAGTVAPGEAVMIKAIEVTGNSLLPAEQLREVVASSEGKMLTLADLQRLANAITALYRKAGYPYSRAYVPAQTLQDGRVRIAIVEARYDDVKLRNNSRARDVVPNVPLSELTVGTPVAQAALDRALLLVSDIPGTTVKGTLRPGHTTGSSELLVDVDPAALISGNVSLDDYGNAATGRPRANANVIVAEPLRLGDSLSLSALTAGRGLNYGGLGYAIPVHGPATVVNVEASALSYRVVYGNAVDLDARGTADVVGGGVKQVLFRSTNVNLYGQISYDETRLRDHLGASAIRTDRHTDDLRVRLFGSTDDATGITSASIGVTGGHLGFDDEATYLADAAGPRAGGGFIKFNVDVSRTQSLTDKTSLFGSFDYQTANTNLDSSEQFFVGGPNNARGYDNGVASGTLGNSFTLELRQRMLESLPGIWQGAVFLDNAHIQIAKNRYAPGPNAGTLTDLGIALDWVHSNGFTVATSLGTPVANTPAIAGHRGSVRFWARVQKAF